MLRWAVVMVAVMVSAAALALPADAKKATCAQQSSASFPGAFTSADNLVVGPLSMIGAGRKTPAAVVEEFDGNKFPVVVKAGRTVTVRIARNSRGSLAYAGRGRARRFTFRACGPDDADSRADGERVTFWSGFVVLSKPACVRLRIRVGGETAPSRERIRMGRDC